MAIKGLSIPVFGYYTNSEGSVTYGSGFYCGHAIEYSVEPETSDDNPLYGDNMIVEHDNGTLTGGTLTLTTSELDFSTSKNLLGLKQVVKGTGSSAITQNVFDDSRVTNTYGFGIIELHQINDVDEYRAVILCKVRPQIPSDAATTKGDSIDWQTKEIEFQIERSDEVSADPSTGYNHPWKKEAVFTTEAEAIAYLKDELGVPAG